MIEIFSLSDIPGLKNESRIEVQVKSPDNFSDKIWDFLDKSERCFRR